MSVRRRPWSHRGPIFVAAALGFAPALAQASESGTEPAPLATPEDHGWDESDTVPATPPAETATHGRVSMQPVGAAPKRDEKLEWRRRQHHRFRGMMISGWTTLGVAYGASILVGAIAIDLGRDGDDERKKMYGRRMMIPIGGPIAAAAVSRSATWAVITVGASAAQIVGLSLGIAGTVKLRHFPNPDKPSFALAALPTRGGGHFGLVGRF